VKESLAELKELAAQNNGQFPEAKVLHYIKEKIKSMPCRNQGYILDGYPSKISEAKDIFKCIYLFF
jgi:adenylate kinase